MNGLNEAIDTLYAELEQFKPALQDIEITYFFNGWVRIAKIIVRRSDRNQGVGTAVMSHITNWANQNGIDLCLSPGTDYGATSISRLVKFYQRFGFVPNKGKHKDFTTRETMVRYHNEYP